MSIRHGYLHCGRLWMDLSVWKCLSVAEKMNVTLRTTSEGAAAGPSLF